MNTLNIDGHWAQKKAKLQKSFNQLTDKDLHYTQGREAELVGRVQHRLGVSKNIVQKIIRYS